MHSAIPTGFGRHLKDLTVQRRIVEGRHLGRQRSSGRHLLQQARAQRRMIRNPLQKRIREHQVERFGGSPVSGISKLKLPVRVGSPRRFHHFRRPIEAQYPRLRPSPPQRFRAGSRTAAQVDDSRRSRDFDAVYQIDGRLRSFIGEFQIRPWIPLWHLNSPALSGA